MATNVGENGGEKHPSPEVIAEAMTAPVHKMKEQPLDTPNSVTESAPSNRVRSEVDGVGEVSGEESLKSLSGLSLKSLKNLESLKSLKSLGGLESLESPGRSRKSKRSKRRDLDVFEARASEDALWSMEELVRFTSRGPGEAHIIMKEGALRYVYVGDRSKIARRLPPGIELRPWELPVGNGPEQRYTMAVRRKRGPKKVPGTEMQVRARKIPGPMRMVGLVPDPLTAFAQTAQHVEGEELVDICLQWVPLKPKAATKVTDQWRNMGYRFPAFAAGGPSAMALGLMYLRISINILGNDTERVLECFKQFSEGSWFVPKKRILNWDGTPRTSGYIVSTGEVGGLLVPPTSACELSNVKRSGGRIPDPPPDLKEWTLDDPDLVPIGRVRFPTGKSFVAGWEAERLLFGLQTGPSGGGKSTRAIAMALPLLRRGEGGLFFDPDMRALRTLTNYLGEEALKRVLTISHDQPRVLGWNTIAASSPEDIDWVVGNTVTASASAMGWHPQGNARAITLTKVMVRSLAEIGLLVPPEDCPTIFQGPTLLGNKMWLEAIKPYLSKPLRDYWDYFFPSLKEDAKTVVTQLAQGFRDSQWTMALLGQSVSTYRIADCMRDGKIVLISPRTEDDTTTKLLTSLLAGDAVRAGLARVMHTEEQPRFWLWLDEVQDLPWPVVEKALTRLRKCGVRVFAFTQNPMQLAPNAWRALATNSTMRATGALDFDGASRFSREWLGDVSIAAIKHLDLHDAIFAARAGDEMAWCKPFKITTERLEDLFKATPEVVVPSVGKTPAEVAEALSTLDDRIIARLETIPRPDRKPAATRAKPAKVSTRPYPAVTKEGNGHG